MPPDTANQLLATARSLSRPTMAGTRPVHAGLKNVQKAFSANTAVSRSHSWDRAEASSITPTLALLSRSATIMVWRRGQRSANTPATGPRNSTGATSATKASPASLADRVSRKTYSGTTTSNSQSPAPDSSWPSQSMPKDRLRRTSARLVRRRMLRMPAGFLPWSTVLQ